MFGGRKIIDDSRMIEPRSRTWIQPRSKTFPALHVGRCLRLRVSQAACPGSGWRSRLVAREYWDATDRGIPLRRRARGYVAHDARH
jgi:hypothetical protein